MLLQNLRYAIRQLGRSGSVTAAAILCLALGIGATTAIFSVVDAVLLKGLPYSDSARLVRVFTEFPTFPNGGLRHFWMSAPELLDLRRDLKSWQQLEAWVIGSATISGNGEPVRATQGYVTGGTFPMLGVTPLFGRTIAPQDDAPGTASVAVLSYGLWQRAYGGDKSILGRDIRADGAPCKVIGVMPPSFEFPPGEVNPVEFWVPAQIDPGRPGGRGSHSWSVLGRLKPGVSTGLAADELKQYVAQATLNATPNFHGFHSKNHILVVNGFQDEVVKNVRLAMLVLLGAVVFVLLISSVNVANLLLARAESRRREIAVRKAIGASIWSLLGQFITEGIVLSSVGAIAGIGLAYGILRMIVRANPGSLPRASEIGIDGRVLLFTTAISVLTGIIFGLAPIMHLVGQNLHETLKAAGGRTIGASGSHSFRRALVVVELALALVLLIGAGLMVKAFWRLQAVNAGLNPENVLTMRVTLPDAGYPKQEDRRSMWLRLHNSVRALPGVQASALVSGLPPARPIQANDTMIEGFVRREGGPIQNIDYWNTVAPGYFDTMGVRVIDGRVFDDRDGQNAPSVVVVNQTMAKIYWPNDSAIGKRVRLDSKEPWRTVVGVVEDARNAGLDRPAGTELYFPLGQAFVGTSEYLVVRADRPSGLLSAIRKQVADLEPAAPVSNIRMMGEVLDSARARPRFLSVMLASFSTVALILAAVGIYGVLAFSVVQRTSEIGIRMAMGAAKGDVLKLILREGVIVGLAGTALGAVGAFMLVRVMQGLLFGVSSFDVATFSAMAALLIVVTLLACYLPARRASATDPLIALRYE